MNVWKFISGVCLLLVIGLAVALLWGGVFRPVLKEREALEAEKAALEARQAELEARLRELREMQARLESDPRFVEKIAREDLGYAKDGEVVFKFVEEAP